MKEIKIENQTVVVNTENKDIELSETEEQISGYVYVVFSEWKHRVGTNYGDWSPQYEYEKEILFVIDNENKAKEIVAEYNATFGQDENVNYYYEKWEVMHHE